MIDFFQIISFLEVGVGAVTSMDQVLKFFCHGGHVQLFSGDEAFSQITQLLKYLFDVGSTVAHQKRTLRIF